ncbi:uncharacterized protein LOC144632375 [Oculina patagonica]
MKGIKTTRIILNAERKLLQERIRQCDFTIRKYEENMEELKSSLQSKVSTEINNRILTLFANTHSSHFEEAKSRQRHKFDRLQSKQKTELPTLNTEDTKIDQRKWVINLSDRSLTDSEQSVLMKGLNFSVTPSKIPVEDIVAATELACTQLKDKSQAESLRNEVVKIISKSKPPRSNISKAEREAIKYLAKDDSIVILPADKGRTTVILNKQDYHTKVKALLDDTNTYEKLTSDPTGSIKNKLIQTLRNWRKEEKIPGYLYNQLYPTAENVPKFYGLPKIHKKDAPLRPIVSSIGSVMYDTAKFLAKIMKPLVGLNGHHIVNSEDFVNKIAELEVPPGQKLVSYDVSALFTSIPINEAISVTKAKLEGDSSLPDRCPLDITQLSTLLEMCLSSTYFTYQHEFYKQKQGAAMGSPISPIVANLYMEQFESRALDTAPTPPTMWYRYVDDTMAKIHEHAVDSFSDHLNSIDQHIQFTSEQEKEGKIPFLDTCVHVNQDGSTKISVYRKPTHTDQYLNFHSNHHLQHKRAVVNTLMLRAQTLVTEDEDKTREAQHVKQALKVNNYPDWMLTIPHSKSGTKEPENEKKIYASAPYIKGISERLQRAFKSHEVTLIHKPVNSLRSQLVHVKDKTSNLKKCGTVYQVQCSGFKNLRSTPPIRNLWEYPPEEINNRMELAAR